MSINTNNRECMISGFQGITALNALRLNEFFSFS